MYAGTWAGSMCLTEPHAGTDLGIIRKAEPQADGSYKISGTKIFITGGEHDLTENIIHLVLAKLPDARPGRRASRCSWYRRCWSTPTARSAQEQPGLRLHRAQDGDQGPATCVMNFDGATGWLVGEVNKAWRRCSP